MRLIITSPTEKPSEIIQFGKQHGAKHISTKERKGLKIGIYQNKDGLISIGLSLGNESETSVDYK